MSLSCPLRGGGVEVEGASVFHVFWFLHETKKAVFGVEHGLDEMMVCQLSSDRRDQLGSGPYRAGY